MTTRPAPKRPSPRPVYPERGLFVAFEGGDGAGKSTQSALLVTSLRARGYEVIATSEPGGSDVGRAIRAIVLDPATGEIDDRTETLLYAADKAEHVGRVVQPALDRGAVVVTDRYVDSTLAYQGAGRQLGTAAVEAVARWATRELRPHLTVVLDVAPGHGLQRLEGVDRLEAEPLDFHERVRAEFLRLADEDRAHYLVLDARRPVDDLASAVAARIDVLLASADLAGTPVREEAGT